MVQLLTPSDSNSTAADTVRAMYVQMLDIYQKYRKNRKYRKSLIFSIFSKISRYFPTLSVGCICRQLVSFYKTWKQGNESNRMCFVHVAKFWHSNIRSGGEGHSLSDVGLLCARAQGRLCRVHRGRSENHGVTPQVLLP